MGVLGRESSTERITREIRIRGGVRRRKEVKEKTGTEIRVRKTLERVVMKLEKNKNM